MVGTIAGFFLNQGPFCGATDCPYFGLRVTLPMGFKAGVVLSPVPLLAWGEPNSHVWCYTCLFHQQGHILYKHEYSRPTFWTPLMQAAEGRQQWVLTFGSSEIWSRAARSRCKCAIHSATPAGLIASILHIKTVAELWSATLVVWSARSKNNEAFHKKTFSPLEEVDLTNFSTITCFFLYFHTFDLHSVYYQSKITKKSCLSNICCC